MRNIQDYTPNWWQVSTNLQGSEVIGYVNSTFLTAAKDFVEPETQRGVTSVHLQRTSEVTRKNKAWAFALNEAGQPTRKSSDSKPEKAAALTSIAKWLDVENPNHLRYYPGKYTYCNIYAYDYCYLAGVYLPHVWWDADALIDLAAGKKVAPIYGKTVEEQSANALFNWLKNFGSKSGWRRTTSLEEMQEAANNGQVAVICAKHKISTESGHIVMVVPETSLQKAERSGGIVVKPVQSQAGRNNYRYQTNTWWISRMADFREHGFWINAL